MIKLIAETALVERPACMLKQQQVRHGQVCSYYGRVERPAFRSRLRRKHHGRAASRARTAAAVTAVAAAEQAKLDIDESSRLAGGKVKVIGESHNGAWILITCNAVTLPHCWPVAACSRRLLCLHNDGMLQAWDPEAIVQWSGCTGVA